MTKNDRIYSHYKSKKHESFHLHSDSDLILFLARHWKMPCKEIKTIVRGFQRTNRLASNQIKYGPHSFLNGTDIIKDGNPVYYECSICSNDVPMGSCCNCEGQCDSGRCLRCVVEDHQQN